MNYMTGWIRLYRKLAEKAFYSKDSEMVHLWVHLLFCANHKGREESLGGKPFMCKPGQFTTGRKLLSKETGISESKIERILFKFENIEQQIEQRKTTTNRLISILNWKEYQSDEQPFEQQANSDRTTSEQRVNTPKEIDNVNNDKKTKVESCFLFEDFWKIYPVKNGKAEAEKKYAKLSEEDRLAIKNTMQSFLDNPLFKGYNYPMATTFINQKRWHDFEQKTETKSDQKKPVNGMVDTSRFFDKLCK